MKTKIPLLKPENNSVIAPAARSVIRSFKIHSCHHYKICARLMAWHPATAAVSVLRRVGPSETV